MLNREPRNGELVGDKDDSKLFVQFYLNPTDDLDHVKIMIPGDKHHQPDFIADDRHKRRFPIAWRIYKGELAQFHGQTRLETVAWIDAGNVREFKNLEIHTVEQLAGMSDGTLSTAGMMGLRRFREKAIKYLAETEKTSAYDEVKSENADLKERLGKLEAMMTAQSTDVSKRRPGRPRKDA